MPPPPYAKLKIYIGTLLTAGIIIISTPVSAIVWGIASINLLRKFAHWFRWIIHQANEYNMLLYLRREHVLQHGNKLLNSMFTIWR